MKRSDILGLVSAALVLSNCGQSSQLVASRFVKSEDVTASKGATITLTAADDPTLAGTQIVIAPNALSRDTRITIGLANGPITPGGTRAAGPTVEFGPSGTQFSSLTFVTLPFALPGGSSIDGLIVNAVEASGTRYLIPRDDLQISGTLVSFAVSGFTAFEPDLVLGPDSGCTSNGSDCSVDADCCSGSYCANLDAGAGSCAMYCVLNGFACVNNTDCCSGSCPPAGGEDGDAGTSTCDQACSPTDGYCTLNKDCCSGYCQVPDGGECGLPDGGCETVAGVCAVACVTDCFACFHDADCCSGYCSFGVNDGGYGEQGNCAEPPGGGPACVPACASCWTGLDCCSGSCANGGGTDDGGPSWCCTPTGSLCASSAECCGGVCGARSDGGSQTCGPNCSVDGLQCFSDGECCSGHCGGPLDPDAGSGTCLEPVDAG